MDINEIVALALPIVYVLVGAALVWLVIELVMTARKTRKTVDELQKQVQPTLASVERITASLEPVAAKVDPLVERVSLTVDAANLEIMRLDQILEDVNEITDTVSSTVEAVDSVTNAPLELVSSVSTKVRNAFKPRRASDESVALGQAKGEEAEHDQRGHHVESSAEREEKMEAKHAAADKTAEAAAHVAEAVTAAVNADATPGPSYFTYNDAKPSTDAPASSDSGTQGDTSVK